MSKVIKNYKKIKYGPALEDDKDVLEWINNIPSPNSLFIGGKWTRSNSKKIIQAINPSNNNKLFKLLVSSKSDVDKKFSGMINALSYGAPPHGGLAPGIDRIVMLLADEKNIREVTLFPLNQNAQDLLMDAPSEVSEKQLKELNIKLVKK